MLPSISHVLRKTIGMCYNLYPRGCKWPKSSRMLRVWSIWTPYTWKPRDLSKSGKGTPDVSAEPYLDVPRYLGLERGAVPISLARITYLAVDCHSSLAACFSGGEHRVHSRVFKPLIIVLPPSRSLVHFLYRVYVFEFDVIGLSGSIAVFA